MSSSIDTDETAENREVFTPPEEVVKEQALVVPATQTYAKSTDLNYLGEGARRCKMQLRKETWNSPRYSCNTGSELITPLLGMEILQLYSSQQWRNTLVFVEYGWIDKLQTLSNEWALVVGYGEPHYHKVVELVEHNGHKTASWLLRHFRNLGLRGDSMDGHSQNFHKEYGYHRILWTTDNAFPYQIAYCYSRE